MTRNRTVRELKERDRGILLTLTHRVRVLSAAQIGRTWWSDTVHQERNALRRIAELSDEGFVEIARLQVHPELSLRRPLATWQPGLSAPDFADVARRAQARWTESDGATPLVIASSQASNVFGGFGGRFPRESEATHDIHLSAVYLKMMRVLPTRAESWTPEAALAKGQGIKVPDAMVKDGRDHTAIEFGGQYGRRKLEEFHQYCDDRQLGYEIW